MILQSTATVALGPVCLVSNSKINTELLRDKLDKLRMEADTTRAKANSARWRLMRLSEAAEKFKRQASVSVNSGKENEARDLLFQKKKVLQAMERSKSRIELLDQLSVKLNEAISVKESLLIENIADLEVDGEDASGPVWIVSPREGVIQDKDEDKNSINTIRHSNNLDLKFYSDEEASPLAGKGLGFPSRDPDCDDSIIMSLDSIPSYDYFLEHIDLGLYNIESELVTVLNMSALFMSDEDKTRDLKLQQMVELLESVRAMRNRIDRNKSGK